MGHDAEAQPGRTVAPTQITHRRWDVVTSTRFAPAPTAGIKGSQLLIIERLSHAGRLHEDAQEFNRVTLEFLVRRKL